jgi:hypothetical protein
MKPRYGPELSFETVSSSPSGPPIAQMSFLMTSISDQVTCDGSMTRLAREVLKPDPSSPNQGGSKLPHSNTFHRNCAMNQQA